VGNSRPGRDNYDMFEGMHYVCFHYEFEHDMSTPDSDPDEDCGAAGCPSAEVAGSTDGDVVVLLPASNSGKQPRSQPGIPNVGEPPRAD